MRARTQTCCLAAKSSASKHAPYENDISAFHNDLASTYDNFSTPVYPRYGEWAIAGLIKEASKP